MKERLLNTIREMMNESNNATIYLTTTLLWNKEPASHEVSLLKRKKEGAPIRVIEEDGDDVFVLPVKDHESVTHLTITRGFDEVVEFYPYEFDGEIVEDGKPAIEGRDILKQLFAVRENEIDNKPSNNFQIQPNPVTNDIVELPIGIDLPCFEVTLHPVNYTFKFFYGRQLERYGVLEAVAQDIPYHLHVDDEMNKETTYTDPAYKAFELFEDTLAAAVYLRMQEKITKEPNPMWNWDGERYPRLIMGTEFAGRTVMIQVLEEAEHLAGARINLQPFHDNRGEFARWLNSDGADRPTGNYERPNVIQNPTKLGKMGMPGVYARVLESQSADYHFIIGYLNAFKEKMMYLNVPQAYIETAMMTHAAELIHEFYYAARYLADDKQKFDEWFAGRFFDIIGAYYGAIRPTHMEDVARVMETMADPVGLLFESVMKGAKPTQTFQPFYQTMIHFLVMMELSEKYNVRLSEVTK